MVVSIHKYKSILPFICFWYKLAFFFIVLSFLGFLVCLSTHIPFWAFSTHWRIITKYSKAVKIFVALYLNRVVIWLIDICHWAALLAVCSVVVFAVLVLHRIDNTLSAFKSKLEAQLRPSIATLHHCFDLKFTKYKSHTIKEYRGIIRKNEN